MVAFSLCRVAVAPRKWCRARRRRSSGWPIWPLLELHRRHEFSAPTTSTIPTSCGSTPVDPVPGVAWARVRDVARVVRARRLEQFTLTRRPRHCDRAASASTCESSGAGPSTRRPSARRSRLAREVSGVRPGLATSRWWKEERHGVFLDYNQNTKTNHRQRLLGAAHARRTGVGAPWPQKRSAPTTRPTSRSATIPSHSSQEIRKPPCTSAMHPCSLEPAARAVRSLLPTLPNSASTLPPLTCPQAGRRRASSRRAARAERPLIRDLARAPRKDAALAGLERWRARRLEAAAHLAPADILVDAMGGRFHTWTRIRVNLEPRPGRPAPVVGTAGIRTKRSPGGTLGHERTGTRAGHPHPVGGAGGRADLPDAHAGADRARRAARPCAPRRARCWSRPAGSCRSSWSPPAASRSSGPRPPARRWSPSTARASSPARSTCSPAAARWSGRASAEAGEVIELDREQLLALVQTDTELERDLHAGLHPAPGGADRAAASATSCSSGRRIPPGTLRIQEFLTRNGHPYTYIDLDRDPDVQALLDRFHVGVADVPVLICRGERGAAQSDQPGDRRLPRLQRRHRPDARARRGRSSAPDRRGWRRPCTAPRKGSTCWCSKSNAPGGQAGSSSKIENYLGFPDRHFRPGARRAAPTRRRRSSAPR